MTIVFSRNPQTQEIREEIASTPSDEIRRICEDAQRAFEILRTQLRESRAEMLRHLASALEASRDALVDVAGEETALGCDRLNNELNRTSFQLRLFADVIEEGSYLEATIDHATDTPMGPRPDLRRMLVPIGPVAVFGASNFPFAFSVPGGDTASALAAGCPVIAKAHESHPATSLLVAQVMRQALAESGAPEGTLAIVIGREEGALLVSQPEVKAVGFTGSVGGAKALMAAIDQRPDPIPFYGELSSINPVVVTPAAAEERADEIGAGLAESITLGGGQFCTKPGLVFLPQDDYGRRVADALAEGIASHRPVALLNDNIATAYRAHVTALGRLRHTRPLAAAEDEAAPRLHARAAVFEVPAADLQADHLSECFGPTAVVVTYESIDELLPALAKLPASLTCSFHLSRTDRLDDRLTSWATGYAGRLVFNGYPTGVAVSWAQHHGGMWPSTNTLHTSVGASALRRFLRPLAWQDAPSALLPDELQDTCSVIPRRVDGLIQSN